MRERVKGRLGLNAVALVVAWVHGRAAVRAIALVAITLLLAGCNLSQTDGVRIAGGCDSQKSTYLAKDPSLLYSRISYCAEGDASVSRIELHVPAAFLARNQLVVAGYPANPGLTATISNDAGESIPIGAKAAESWQSISIPASFLSRTRSVKVVVDDQSTQAYGWAGVGVAPQVGPARDYRWAALVSILIFSLILVRDFWRLRSDRRNGESATSKTSQWVTCGLLGALTFTTVIFRRPDQLLHPYIWVEEGTVSLKQFLTHGASFLFEPVAGYLIVPSKVIFLLSTMVATDQFPLALALGSIVFCWLTLTALAIAPSHLKAPASLAAFVLLLPTASENYFTALYSFWFGSLLLLPPLFWKETGKRRLPLRLGMVATGGLSSPVVIALLPGFAYRLILERNAASLLQALVAGIASAVQLYFIKFSGSPSPSASLRFDVNHLIEKFFGLFWSPTDDTAIHFGLAIIVILLAFALRSDGPRRRWAALGVYCLFASILITAARVPLEALHPAIGAPRYFFLPYIFLGLVVLQLLPGSKSGNLSCAAILAFALTRFYAIGPQPHVAISWKHQLEMCASANGRYQFPVHYYGSKDPIWHVDLSSDDCRTIASDWGRRPRPTNDKSAASLDPVIN